MGFVICLPGAGGPDLPCTAGSICGRRGFARPRCQCRNRGRIGTEKGGGLMDGGAPADGCRDWRRYLGSARTSACSQQRWTVLTAARSRTVCGCCRGSAAEDGFRPKEHAHTLQRGLTGTRWEGKKGRWGYLPV